MKFENLIGQHILLKVHRIDPTVYQHVKLLGVEAGGLWIESQTLTNAMLQAMGVASAPKTAAFFFPYHEISFAITSIEGPALDEKAFGI
jgi:hypothetical protein